VNPRKYFGVAAFVANGFENPQLRIRSLLRSLKKDSILSTLKVDAHHFFHQQLIMISIIIFSYIIIFMTNDLGGEVLLFRFLLNLSMFSPKTSPVLRLSNNIIVF